MNDIKIEATTTPDKTDIKILDEGIGVYNDSKIGPRKNIPICSFARQNGEVIGGITGSLFWDYLYIDIMWIDEEYRNKGIGSQLIFKLEQLSMDNGIYRSHLCTSSFQSVGFYEKCGYKIFGKLDDMPEGETEYYLFKRLSK